MRTLLRRGSPARAATLAALLAGAAAAPGRDDRPPAARQPVPLSPGMVITESITVRPGVYRLGAPPDPGAAAITIRGDGITLDLNGAELTGSPDGADPDTFAGVGVLVDGGSKVTIRNGTIRGYKVGILARRSPDLRITRNDLSHNWKQRLYSGIEQESLVDWMSYHQNEQDEWLRFGAAIYLADSDRAEIDHNTILQGQNGVMATRSSRLKIWNNTIQFLSSIGVGLYRVTGSTIMHNRIDWCVRGYSHGFYNRGQDSAGLLMYEQSSGNTVAYNSITHGGDGLFLWAGQSTMDTGRGGANDNVFYRNDFSHAPTNGIEATFSRNRFHENRVEDCWHGVWGGYSYESVWQGNRFARNAEGMAIEHGQSNRIVGNTFDGDEVGIRLWQNATQDPEWGYPKHRDTRSRAYEIGENVFRQAKTALQVRDTAGVSLWRNTFAGVGTTVSLAGATPGFAIDGQADRGPAAGAPAIEPLEAGIDPMIGPGGRRGRDTIIVDEWGPYDWKSPKLWPVLEADGNRTLPYSPAPGPTPARRATRLRVLGPPGAWRVASVRGGTVSAVAGRTGDQVVVTPGAARGAIDWTVALEYRGGEVTSPRGARTAAGAPYVFEYSRFFVPVAWTVRFFEYTAGTDPVKQPDAFATLLAGAPLRAVSVDRLDYLSGRPLDDGLPRDRFALAAEGTADIPGGDYLLQVISDDGVRVWVDDRLAIDAWEPHESRVDAVPIAGGTRRLRVHYYEIGGFAELRLDIRKKPRAVPPPGRD